MSKLGTYLDQGVAAGDGTDHSDREEGVVSVCRGGVNAHSNNGSMQILRTDVEVRAGQDEVVGRLGGLYE